MPNTIPFILANRQGIPRLESIGVTVGTNDVRFRFNPHMFLNRPFSGLILFKLSQEIPTGTTTTLPIVFDTNGVSQNVTTFNDANVTVAEMSGTGIYLAYYDSTTGSLQLLTGI